MEADVTQRNDGYGLDLGSEMWLLEDFLNELDRALEVLLELVLQVGGEVLQDASRQSLAHLIELSLGITDSTLDQLKYCRCYLLNVCGAQGVEQAVHNQESSTSPFHISRAYLLQDLVNFIYKTFIVELTLQAHDQNLKQTAKIVDERLLFMCSVSTLFSG